MKWQPKGWGGKGGLKLTWMGGVQSIMVKKRTGRERLVRQV